MEFNFNSYDNSKQSISYCEVDKCKAVIKLNKCLQEIKEIAEKIADECQIEPYGACALEAKEQILQKISEVEDEN
jgi:hypothetical protein